MRYEQLIARPVEFKPVHTRNTSAQTVVDCGGFQHPAHYVTLCVIGRDTRRTQIRQITTLKTDCHADAGGHRWQ